MTQAIIAEVRAAQNSMVDAADPWFTEWNLDHMRVLIRLTIEFFHFLQGEDPVPGVDDKLVYMCDSIFSGVESFQSVSSAYRGFRDARPPTLTWDGFSTDSLTREFIPRYRELSRAVSFEQRCRLLLDLFKLQIVFAGVAY